MAATPRRTKAHFCTECGEELTNFWKTPVATDMKALLLNRKECLDKGRPHDRLCSKIFMADSGNTTQAIASTPKTPSRRVAQLKKSVLARIEGEDTRPVRVIKTKKRGK